MIGYKHKNSHANAWKKLVKILEMNTKAKKLLLKLEFDTIRHASISMNEYALNIIKVLGSISFIMYVEDFVGAYSRV